MVKKNNIGIIIVIILAVLLVGYNQLFVIIESTWYDEESFVSWEGGDWREGFPVTNAFDENSNTVALLHGPAQEANIYETTNMGYDFDDSLVTSLQFEVIYKNSILTDNPSSIKYYVWNYQTSSWDLVYTDSTDSGCCTKTKIITVNPLNHISNKQVGLRTHVDVGLLNAMWLFETRVRVLYDLPQCSQGETMCEGNTYFTCGLDFNWEEQGIVIDQCGVECIPDIEDSMCLGFEGFTCLEDYTWMSEGFVIDQCEVECIEDSDCGENEICPNYICFSEEPPPQNETGEEGQSDDVGGTTGGQQPQGGDIQIDEPVITEETFFERNRFAGFIVFIIILAALFIIARREK